MKKNNFFGLLLIFSLISSILISCNVTPSKTSEIESTVIAEVSETKIVETTQNVTNSEITPLTPAEMKEMMDQDKEYILIDVRSQEEFNQGHISGAKSIPVSELEGRLDELSKNEKIIVYCQSGQRSKTAAEILMKNGFNSIYNLGGIEDWIKAGYPVVTEEAESTVDDQKTYEVISVDEA